MFTNKWFILLILIFAALGCYALGGMLGLGLFIVLGLIFELMFWRKLFTRNKKTN